MWRRFVWARARAHRYLGAHFGNAPGPARGALLRAKAHRLACNPSAPFRVRGASCHGPRDVVGCLRSGVGHTSGVSPVFRLPAGLLGEVDVCAHHHLRRPPHSRGPRPRPVRTRFGRRARRDDRTRHRYSLELPSPNTSPLAASRSLAHHQQPPRNSGEAVGDGGCAAMNSFRNRSYGSSENTPAGSESTKRLELVSRPSSRAGSWRPRTRHAEPPRSPNRTAQQLAQVDAQQVVAREAEEIIGRSSSARYMRCNDSPPASAIATVRAEAAPTYHVEAARTEPLDPILERGQTADLIHGAGHTAAAQAQADFGAVGAGRGRHRPGRTSTSPRLPDRNVSVARPKRCRAQALGVYASL